QFVLVTNAEQLRASIRHVYGLNEQNSRRYLDKFVGYSFALPHRHSPTSRGIRINRTSVTHYRVLSNQSKWVAGSSANHSGRKFVERLIISNQLSLREVETWLRYLEIYQIVTHQEGFGNNDAFV